MEKRVAKIILLNGNKTLLQHRDKKRGISFPDTWSLLGGQIDGFELPIDAIKREIKEEIGIDLIEPKLIRDQVRFENDTRVTDYVFLDNIDIPVSDIKLAEGQEVKYFDLASIKNLDVSPHFKDVLISELGKPGSS